jgi:hypothetical protein
MSAKPRLAHRRVAVVLAPAAFGGVSDEFVRPRIECLDQPSLVILNNLVIDKLQARL